MTSFAKVRSGMQRTTPWQRIAPALALLACLSLAPAPGRAEPPVRIIVPLAPGSTADVAARLMGQHFAQALGRPVVVENLPAAGGVPGTAQLVRAPNDGSVLAMVASNHVINPALYPSMPYDPIGGVTPITVVGRFPLVLVAIPSLPVTNAGGLITLARQRPGRLHYGSGGNGSILHLAAELFRSEAGGLDVRHVPYQGSAQMVTDLLGRRIDFAFLAVTVAAPLVKAGKVRALGLSGAARSNLLPGVPTLAEEGLAGYRYDAWIALVAPAGMRPALVTRLHALSHQVLASSEGRAALARHGVEMVASTPAQAGAFLRAELAKQAALVRRSGATMD